MKTLTFMEPSLSAKLNHPISFDTTLMEEGSKDGIE
jgi:hypothetical protein